MSLLLFKRSDQLLLLFTLLVGWLTGTIVIFQVTEASELLFSSGLLVVLALIYLKFWILYKSKVSFSNSWKKAGTRRLGMEWIWGTTTSVAIALLFILSYSLFKNNNFFVQESTLFLLFCFVFWTIFANFGGEFLHLIKQSKIVENRIRNENKEQVKIQKEILQDLISPHFLFNSLNTIISIIPENKENSMRFVDELSELYNFMLKNSQKEAITLSEDLFLAKKYVFLLQTRLESSLNVSFDIDRRFLASYIPPFTLQNLIENAVKHNSVTKKLSLSIEIYIDQDYLIVKNNLNPKMLIPENSTSLGLNYITTLLEALSDLPIIVEKTEFDFVVKIPLIYHLNQEHA